MVDKGIPSSVADLHFLSKDQLIQLLSNPGFRIGQHIELIQGFPVLQAVSLTVELVFKMPDDIVLHRGHQKGREDIGEITQWGTVDAVVFHTCIHGGAVPVLGRDGEFPSRSLACGIHHGQSETNSSVLMWAGREEGVLDLREVFWFNAVPIIDDYNTECVLRYALHNIYIDVMSPGVQGILHQIKDMVR